VYRTYQVNDLYKRNFESDYFLIAEILYWSYQWVVILALEQVLDQGSLIDASLACTPAKFFRI